VAKGITRSRISRDRLTESSAAVRVEMSGSRFSRGMCVSSFEPSVVSLLGDVGDVVGQALRPEKKGSGPMKENSGRVPASPE
jgi:hypothetical protein